MRHFALPRFWKLYRQLPLEIQKLADRNYQLLKQDAKHPSLHFKCINSDENIWSVRVSKGYRAIGVIDGDKIIWFWIGNHDDYEKFFG